MPNIVIFALRWLATEAYYPQYCPNIHGVIKPSLSFQKVAGGLDVLTEEELDDRCQESTSYILYGIVFFFVHEMLYNWYVFCYCQAHTNKYENYKLSEFSYTYFKNKVLFRKSDGKPDLMFNILLNLYSIRTKLNKVYRRYCYCGKKASAQISSNDSKKKFSKRQKIYPDGLYDQMENESNVVNETLRHESHGNKRETSGQESLLSTSTNIEKTHQWIYDNFVLVYVILRVVFTFIMILPTMLFYRYYYLHVFFILGVLINGAYCEGKFQTKLEKGNRRERKKSLSMEILSKTTATNITASVANSNEQNTTIEKIIKGS